MRIGLIAMSGVRVVNPDLVAAGMTMPTVVDRIRTIASMPSLGLLTLAALTPADVDVHYVEIDDLRRAPGVPGDYDLVAISSFSAQIFEAYELAQRYRAAGTPVVMGGLHVSMLPDEALRHCDCVVIGEGEPLWAQVVADFRAGRLQARYGPAARPFDLASAPLPRLDLLDARRYNRMPVQTSRGCPHLCDFCASSVLLTSKYAVKPVEKVIAEVRAVKARMARPFIEFADDNSFANRTHYRRLLEALRDEQVRWFTETDISIAEDPDLLTLMRESGCRQVLIGLETPQAGGLRGIEVRRDWKLRKLPGYAAAIREIQSHGITVNGCFILGLDGDGPEVFDAVEEFAMRTALFDVQLTVMTPFPGTPLYHRLEQAGRLLHPGAWNRCTLFDVNYQPTHMSVTELEDGLRGLAIKLFAPAAVDARRRRYFEDLYCSGRVPDPQRLLRDDALAN